MGKYLYQVVMTPEEEGGYSVDVPDLPGCYSCGDDFNDAAMMAADAAKTYVASLLAHGEEVPPATRRETPSGSNSIYVFFEADPSWVVTGEVISAAEAARQLGVTSGRVSQMISKGVLDGYRDGRRTYVSVASVEARKAEAPRAGRPRKTAQA